MITNIDMIIVGALGAGLGVVLSFIIGRAYRGTL